MHPEWWELRHKKELETGRVPKASLDLTWLSNEDSMAGRCYMKRVAAVGNGHEPWESKARHATGEVFWQFDSRESVNDELFKTLRDCCDDDAVVARCRWRRRR